MIKYHTIYIAFVSLFLMSSCSQGDIPGADDFDSDNCIFFRSNLSKSAESRGPQLVEKDFTAFYVTSYFGSGTEGTPYFQNTEFTKGAGNKYSSTPGYVWPATNMTFVAWYPTNYTFSDGHTITGFSVSNKIAEHIDFVTATAHTSYSNFENDEANGVALNFEHRLSQIGINALSTNPKYKIEVAGVRIGNVRVGGTFDFNGTTNEALSTNTFWSATTPGIVEYIYGSDEILTLGTTAASIMGKGGNAMVIPTGLIRAWNPTTDAANNNGGLYLSVLIRVTATAATANCIQLYPALGLNQNDEVQKTVFTVGNEQKEFAWAAVPITATWCPGKYYTYTLDYSTGVGIRDPKEPNHPGDPILGGDVKADVSLAEWDTISNIHVTVPGTGSGQGTTGN